jgi:hypothetical protein
VRCSVQDGTDPFVVVPLDGPLQSLEALSLNNVPLPELGSLLLPRCFLALASFVLHKASPPSLYAQTPLFRSFMLLVRAEDLGTAGQEPPRLRQSSVPKLIEEPLLLRERRCHCRAPVAHP